MRKCILILFLLLATSSLAQEDYYLVNSPLAALPAHGDYQFTARILDGGPCLHARRSAFRIVFLWDFPGECWGYWEPARCVLTLKPD